MKPVQEGDAANEIKKGQCNNLPLTLEGLAVTQTDVIKLRIADLQYEEDTLNKITNFRKK